MADDLKTFVQKKMPSSTILADIINTIIVIMDLIGLEIISIIFIKKFHDLKLTQI